MKKLGGLSVPRFLALLIPLIAITGTLVRAQNNQDLASAVLSRPDWKIGDQWTVETVSRKMQGRENEPARKPPRLRWKFEVAGVEKLAGRDCYRIDIQCLAKGRIRPDTTVWFDQQSLFIQQFETKLAAAGQYQLVQESYTAQQQTAPVVTPITALPIGMPAFVQQSAKSISSSYTSQPLPAGSKDAGIIRFSHTTSQQVTAASSKSLKLIPETYSKDIEQKPVQEVRLTDDQQSVLQLWQTGQPWPVYANNGQTEAWLVSDAE